MTYAIHVCGTYYEYDLSPPETPRERWKILHRMNRLKEKGNRVASRTSGMSLSWMNIFQHWCELHEIICQDTSGECGH